MDLSTLRLNASKPSSRFAIRTERSAPDGRGKEGGMWLVLAVVFLIAWLVAFIGFHIAMAGIHVLLGLFVLFLIIHFVRRAARHA